MELEGERVLDVDGAPRRDLPLETSWWDGVERGGEEGVTPTALGLPQDLWLTMRWTRQFAHLFVARKQSVAEKNAHCNKHLNTLLLRLEQW